MKKLFFFLLLFSHFIFTKGQSFDFEGITYTVINTVDLTCEITNGRNSKGKVIIPSIVYNDGISYTVTEIGKKAFIGCLDLTEIELPNSILSIGIEAFRHTNLKEIEIPQNTVFIGEFAFYECPLTNVTIPPSIKIIDNNAFDKCNFLEKVIIHDLKAWINIDFPTYFDIGREYTNGNPLEWAHHLYLNDEEIINLEIPDDVIEIKPYVFSGASNIASVKFNKSVSFIGIDAFKNNEGLKKVQIPDIISWLNITFENPFSNPLTYAQQIYDDKEEITNLEIPDGTTEIKDYSFGFASSIKTINIPETLRSVGKQAFQNNISLEKVIIEDLSKWIDIDFKDYGSNPLEYAGHLFLKEKEIIDLNIPEEKTEIKKFAFFGGKYFKSVKIPNNITKIGIEAFTGCSALQKVEINDLVAWCKIEFTPSDNVYGDYFYIGNPLFQAHHLFLNQKEILDLEIPKEVYEIKDGSFAGGSFNSINIPNTVLKIGSEAFRDCLNIKELVLPNSINYIDRMAFYNCEELRYLTLGTDLEKIEDLAFANCLLNKVNCYSINPPYIFYDTFELPKFIVLHVIEGYKKEYAYAQGWSSFGDIIDDLSINGNDSTGENGINEVISDCETNNIKVFLNNGILLKSGVDKDFIKSLPHGIYIIVSGKEHYKISI